MPNPARAACRPGSAACIPGPGRPSGPPRATGGSGRTWPDAGPARRGPGPRWIQRRVDDGTMKLGCLIAPTAADIRDVMVEGPSGLIAVAPPWSRPRFESSKRRVEWPNGARAICLSGEEPERARGLNIDTLWADELACWQRAESTWDLAMLALRAGTNPQALITTTPRRLAVLRRILAEATHRPDDRYHLRQPGPSAAASFSLRSSACMKIPGWAGRRSTPSSSRRPRGSGSPASTRPGTSRSRPSTIPCYFVRCAIDAGTSRHTAAVFFQVRTDPGSDRKRVTVFGDYHALDVVSQKNARAIKALADQLPCHGRIDLVRLDPAASARSSLGPAAYSEYERVFGSRIIARWPQHLVLDGLDTIENLLETGDLKIHPRCTRLKDAFRNYCRQRRGGQWVDFPADGHPEEDMMDALRGGIRDAMPEGLVPGPKVHQVRASGIM